MSYTPTDFLEGHDLMAESPYSFQVMILNSIESFKRVYSLSWKLNKTQCNGQGEGGQERTGSQWERTNPSKHFPNRKSFHNPFHLVNNDWVSAVKTGL